MNTITLTQTLHNYGLTQKVAGWVWRYLPAELTGTAAALLGITVALYLEQSAITIAMIGAWSEILGFYAAMVAQEWMAHRRSNRQPWANNKRISKPGLGWPAICCNCLISVRQTIGFFGQLLRNLVLEFGAAELLDPLILRPALLTLAIQRIPDLPLAVIAGKLVADLLFYTVAIGSLEVRRKIQVALYKGEGWNAD